MIMGDKNKKPIIRRAQMAELCLVPPTTIDKWKTRKTFPKPNAKGEYNEGELLRYAAAAKERAAKAQQGENADLKRAKLEQQVNLLRQQARRADYEADASGLRLKRDQGELVTITEHNERVDAVVQAVVAYVSIFCRTLSAKLKDQYADKEIKACERDCRQLIADKLASA